MTKQCHCASDSVATKTYIRWFNSHFTIKFQSAGCYSILASANSYAESDTNIAFLSLCLSVRNTPIVLEWPMRSSSNQGYGSLQTIVFSEIPTTSSSPQTGVPKTSGVGKINHLQPVPRYISVRYKISTELLWKATAKFIKQVQFPMTLLTDPTIAKHPICKLWVVFPAFGIWVKLESSSLLHSTRVDHSKNWPTDDKSSERRRRGGHGTHL